MDILLKGKVKKKVLLFTKKYKINTDNKHQFLNMWSCHNNKRARSSRFVRLKKAATTDMNRNVVIINIAVQIWMQYTFCRAVQQN